MEKIEFYANRSLGDRLSAAARFIRQNGAVFFKLLLLPAIPLMLIQAFFAMKYGGNFSELINPYAGGVDMDALAPAMGSTFFYMLFTLLLSLYLTGMSGALLSHYDEGLLTKETKFGDVSKKMFSNMGKMFLVCLLLGLILVVALFLIGGLIGFLFASSRGLGVGLGILMVIAIFALLPSFALSYFPAFFQEAGVMASIGKGFSLGLKNWGTTIAVLLIAGVITAIAVYLLGIPYELWVLFSHTGGIVAYILALLASIGTFIATPLSFIFLAFHYFAVVEKAEGISLQSKVDEFDTL